MTKTTFRTTAARLSLAAALLGAVGAAQAGRTHVGIGLNFGFPAIGVGYGGYGYGGYGGWRGDYYRPYYAGYRPYWGGYYGGGVVIAPPPIVYAEPADPPVVVQRAPLVAQATPARPDPVIYPRNGQNPQQTEYDRQQCNRWATTQPAAVADSAVFMRAVEACMDGRGYSVK